MPELRPAVAALIHAEFWADKPGYTPAYFEGRLAEAADPSRLPLCRVAHEGGRLLGTASLIDNDDEARPQLWPWLAAVVIVEAARGQGLGRALVEAILDDALKLGIPTVHLGTDKPDFYARFGAAPLEFARPDLLVMRCPTSRLRAGVAPLAFEGKRPAP